MKKKEEYEVINNQEDEDGYIDYQDIVHISESPIEKQDINSIKSTANTDTSPAKLPLIFPGSKRRISQFIISPSAKQVVTVAIVTRDNEKRSLLKEKNKIK